MSIFTTEDRTRHAAAVRAGIRTAAQSARGAGAALVAAVGSTVIGVSWWIVGGIAAASAIQVAWAGTDAYLGIISDGVPQEYRDASPESDTVEGD